MHGIEYGCPFAAEELFAAVTNDKKISNGRINIITVPELGKAKIKNISFEELKEIIYDR